MSYAGNSIYQQVVRTTFNNCAYFKCSSSPDNFPIRGAGDRYGRGSGDILLDNVVCNGDESSLLNCSHNPLRQNNCDRNHSEDAGVVCGSKWSCFYLMSKMSVLYLLPSGV